MPDARQPRTLPFGLLLRDTLRLFSMHWRRHLVLSVLCTLPLAVLYAAHYFDPLIALFKALATQPEVQRLPDGTPSMTVSAPPGSNLLPMRSLSLLALAIMLISAYASAWWSGLFELKRPGEGHIGQYFHDFIAVLTRLMLVGAIMLGVVIGIEIINQAFNLVLVPLLRPLGAAGFARFIVFALLVTLQQGIWARLVLSVPPTVWGEPMSVLRSWAASAGVTLYLGAAVVLLAVPSLTLALLISLPLLQGMTAAGPIVTAATVLLLGPLIFLYQSLQLTLVAVAFQKLREAGKL